MKTNQMKKTTALAMALWIALAALLGFGAKRQQPEPKDCAPIVFVHGLGGWGQGALFDLFMPHWGMMFGSMRKHLNSLGYETCAVSLGPVSSTWDRACELYAHLTGGRVDYGEAHSKEHGHERYGGTYKKALMKDWSAEKPIALLGHSFGGAAIRLFATLCEEGSAAERAAGQGNLSPLFTGELQGRILAVVSLAAPHNGSTAGESFIEADEDSMGASLPDTFMTIAKAGVVLPIIEMFYPFRLGHFGFNTRSFLRKPIATWRAGDEFIAQEDCSAYDLSIDGAKALNGTIACLPNLYYFSYAAVATVADEEGNQVPEDFVWDMFRGSCEAMGKKRAPLTTPGGVLIDDSWLPNDGLVNLVSAQYPFGDPHKPYDDDAIEPGVWQVMPTLSGFDHVDFAGGMQQKGGVDGYEDFFMGVVGIIEGLG